jgi:IS605 OrfB family transposase
MSWGQNIEYRSQFLAGGGPQNDPYFTCQPPERPARLRQHADLAAPTQRPQSPQRPSLPFALFCEVPSPQETFSQFAAPFKLFTSRAVKPRSVVVIEDLQVKNMSKSATKKVAQKSGLNRSILDASPFELRRQLEYKTQWRSGLLVAVAPQNTSRKCPNCGQVSAANRKSQAKFVGVECGFSAPADLVGAIHIQRGGTRLASLFVVFG